MKLLQRVLFSPKYVHLFMSVAVQVGLCKKQLCSSKWGGTNKVKADTISCYSLCKEAHHKRDLAKSPHEYSCTKVYEVDVFSRNSTTLQNTCTHHPFCRAPCTQAAWEERNVSLLPCSLATRQVVDASKQLSELSLQTKQYSLQKILIPKICKTNDKNNGGKLNLTKP